MFLPRESQGRRSLVGCRLWGRTELDTTEVTLTGQVRGAKPTVLSLVPLSLVISEGVGLTLIGLVLGNHSPPVAS